MDNIDIERDMEQSGATFKKTSVPVVLGRATLEEGTFEGKGRVAGKGGKHAESIAKALLLERGTGWVKVPFDPTDPKEPLRTQTALRGKLRAIKGKREEGNDWLVEVQGSRESGILGIYRPAKPATE
jgi:hypothetical protein